MLLVVKSFTYADSESNRFAHYRKNAHLQTLCRRPMCAHKHKQPALRPIMHSVHKNNVKYLSGMSDRRASRNDGLLSVQKTDLVPACIKRRPRSFNFSELTDVGILPQIKEPALNGIRVQNDANDVAASNVHVDSENDLPGSNDGTIQSVCIS